MPPADIVISLLERVKGKGCAKFCGDPPTAPSPLLRELLDQVAKFRKDEFFHRHFDSMFGTGDGKDAPAFDNAGGGSAHNGRRSHFLVSQKPKDFTESGEPFLQHRINGFECAVSA